MPKPYRWQDGQPQWDGPRGALTPLRTAATGRASNAGAALTRAGPAVAAWACQHLSADTAERGKPLAAASERTMVLVQAQSLASDWLLTGNDTGVPVPLAVAVSQSLTLSLSQRSLQLRG